MKTRLYALAAALILTIMTASGQTKKEMQYNVRYTAGLMFFETHRAVDVSIGYRLNDKRHLGIGTGLHWVEITDDADPERSNGEVTGIPVFVDYTRYLPLRHHQSNSFYFGIDGGVLIYTGKTPLKDDKDDPESRAVPLINGRIGWEITLHDRLALDLGFNGIVSEASAIGVHVGIKF